MATMQCLLRANGNGEFTGEKAHRYGTSIGNQRIECWWSHLKKTRTTWRTNFLKTWFTEGSSYHEIYTTNFEWIWFYFNERLQHDLDFVVFHWNTHYIRQSRPDTVPGRPDDLFFLPEKSGGENHLQYTTQQQLEEVGNSADLEPIDNDNDYQQYWPILYHMISFIQWESEEIIRWVINWNIQTSSLNLSNE